MGNLLGANKSVVPEESLSSYGSLHLSKRKQVHHEDKVVRFRLDDSTVYVDENKDQQKKISSSASSVMKFRIVVSREELINILNHKKGGSRYSSMEELLEGMKVTSRKISHVKIIDSGEVSFKWKLALQNIADDDPNH
ncbi:hypothetical protein FRX31_003880 [Thalictrum thalictroides]|uniref:Uncharacterized protein n=1 Tax=Thalictrum thalictroides TaxID=46969 RepID=A0A7J6XC86_THATH|nr:hypothetical protein FRX31_003880 [Thalictrum thalictroides]